MLKIKIKNNIFTSILIRDIIRFFFGGIINTFFTLILFQLCLFFISPGLSYTISWLAGILFIVIIYPTKVFPKSSNSLKKSIYVTISYIAIYFISIWSLNFFISIGINARLGIFFTLSVSAIVSFLMMRYIYRIYGKKIVYKK